MPRHALLPTLALAAMLGGPAYAQTAPSPEQAKALEAQVTAWLKQVTGNSVTLPARPIELTPEGDHYLVRVPLGGLGKVQPANAAITMKARALDGTRWALDDQQFPADLTVTTSEMVPDAPDAKDPSPTGTHSEAVTYHAVVGKQDVHGVFDPTYSTATTNGGTIASMDLTKTGGAGASTTHLGRMTSQSSTQPTDPAHINLLVDGTGEDYTIKSAMPDGGSISISSSRLHVMSAISGLAHDQLLPVIQSLAAIGKLSQGSHPDGDQQGPTPAEKVAMRDLLQKAHALLTGTKVDESLEGVKFDVSGTSGSIGKVQISFGGDAPQNLLSADMGLTLDGLVVDALPPNLAGFVPTHFTIHPTVSNIAVDALTKMGMDATAPVKPGGSPAPDPDVQALFAHGGLNAGFDKLAMDIAGTTLEGDGKFVVTGPQTVTGQAQFTAKGLDALITKMQADPMLAQGVPVVIFLKGIARTTADQSVWQVSVNNTKLLVNGVDLSAMAGAMSK
ncbi:hypothetical protein [Acidisphaera sp. L21]|uniref:hypothetical protein n=1 Tax=Acidisphaera sp. L21 TaxID=1641851 RepID=UPI00131DCFE4|nr:hypothetical protein [Acidisphaera sp. L21]